MLPALMCLLLSLQGKIKCKQLRHLQSLRGLRQGLVELHSGQRCECISAHHSGISDAMWYWSHLDHGLLDFSLELLGALMWPGYSVAFWVMLWAKNKWCIFCHAKCVCFSRGNVRDISDKRNHILFNNTLSRLISADHSDLCFPYPAWKASSWRDITTGSLTSINMGIIL